MLKPKALPETPYQCAIPGTDTYLRPHEQQRKLSLKRKSLKLTERKF